MPSITPFVDACPALMLRRHIPIAAVRFLGGLEAQLAKGLWSQSHLVENTEYPSPIGT